MTPWGVSHQSSCFCLPWIRDKTTFHRGDPEGCSHMHPIPPSAPVLRHLCNTVQGAVPSRPARSGLQPSLGSRSSCCLPGLTSFQLKHEIHPSCPLGNSLPSQLSSTACAGKGVCVSFSLLKHTLPYCQPSHSVYKSKSSTQPASDTIKS